MEAGPNRKEIMERDVMEACLRVCREQKVKTVDITGGAPEMNPHFEWFVKEVCKMCSHVIVRSNLAVSYTHLDVYKRQDSYPRHRIFP